MLALFAPTVLLLASVAIAQSSTPSVVTYQSIPPVPTTEGVFTIQTSEPVFVESSVCAVCFMEPCPPCAQFQ